MIFRENFTVGLHIKLLKKLLLEMMALLRMSQLNSLSGTLMNTGLNGAIYEKFLNGPMPIPFLPK